MKKIIWALMVTCLFMNTLVKASSVPVSKGFVKKEMINGKWMYIKYTSRLRNILATVHTFPSRDFNHIHISKGGSLLVDQKIRAFAIKHNLGYKFVGTGDYYSDLPSDYQHPAFDIGGTKDKFLTIKEEYLEDVQLFCLVNSFPIKDANEETRASIKKYLMDGHGILGTHGTIAGKSTWENPWSWWLDNVIAFPNYQTHPKIHPLDVYLDAEERNHVVLDGIFQSHMTATKTVPNGGTARNPQMVELPVRNMVGEWFCFNGLSTELDVLTSTEPKWTELQNNFTPLIRYDARESKQVKSMYKRPTGNIHSHIMNVGSAKFGFFPMGHDARDFSSFDNGSDDLDILIGNMAFYLAGYEKSSCDKSCNGLVLVDENDRIIKKDGESMKFTVELLN